MVASQLSRLLSVKVSLGLALNPHYPLPRVAGHDVAPPGVALVALCIQVIGNPMLIAAHHGREIVTEEVVG